MAKNKKDEIPHYELLFIVPNKFTIDELKPIIKKVKGIIIDNGGEITFSEEWGNKKLAYPIKHFTHGYYNLFEFDADSLKVAQINNIIKMDNDVIRHLLVSKTKRTLEEIKEEKKVEKERRDASKIEKGDKNEKRKSPSKIKKADISPKEKVNIKEKKITEKTEKKDSKKVNLEDLDEKLDKILETNDLL